MDFATITAEHIFRFWAPASSLIKEGSLRAAEVVKNIILTTHFNWTVLEAQKELEALLEICCSYECLFLVLSFFVVSGCYKYTKKVY